jgi:hypothetical protein
MLCINLKIKKYFFYKKKYYIYMEKIYLAAGIVTIIIAIVIAYIYIAPKSTEIPQKTTQPTATPIKDAVANNVAAVQIAAGNAESAQKSAAAAKAASDAAAAKAASDAAAAKAASDAAAAKAASDAAAAKAASDAAAAKAASDAAAKAAAKEAAAVFGNPTANATPWNDEGYGNSAYLDRHDINCNGKALNGLHLVRKGDGNFHYEYTCEANGDLNPSVDRETPWNDYGGGNTIYMDRHALDCGTGNVLTQLRLGAANNQIQYKYKCAPAKKTLTCRDLSTPLNDDGGGNTIYMDRHVPACGPNEAMSKLRYARGPDGRTGQYQYTCCA